MCFYDDDCDWLVQVSEENYSRCETADECCDCNRPIQSGEWCRQIYQLEYEECQICEDVESGLYEDPDEVDEAEGIYGPGEHPHYFGQSWQGTICRECCLVREAIWDLEEKEGCPPYARQPLLGGLREVIHDDLSKWGTRKYVTHAKEMFPELASHKLLL